MKLRFTLIHRPEMRFIQTIKQLKAKELYKTFNSLGNMEKYILEVHHTYGSQAMLEVFINYAGQAGYRWTSRFTAGELWLVLQRNKDVEKITTYLIDELR